MKNNIRFALVCASIVSLAAADLNAAPAAVHPMIEVLSSRPQYSAQVVALATQELPAIFTADNPGRASLDFLVKESRPGEWPAIDKPAEAARAAAAAFVAAAVTHGDFLETHRAALSRPDVLGARAVRELVSFRDYYRMTSGGHMEYLGGGTYGPTPITPAGRRIQEISGKIGRFFSLGPNSAERAFTAAFEEPADRQAEETASKVNALFDGAGVTKR